MYQVQNWTREKKNSCSEFEEVVVKRKFRFSCEKNFLMIFRESFNFNLNMFTPEKRDEFTIIKVEVSL